MPADIRDRVRRAALELAAARERWRQATESAKEVAREAHAGGMTEVELADELGVDRSKTLRRWLGK